MEVRYKLKKFIENFPLPQAVKVRSLNSLTCRSNQRIGFNETVVLHSIRTIEIIRVTDSLNHEFFLPKDATSRVEVAWKNYKKLYKNVGVLSEDFPSHVLVKEIDPAIDIKKGSILKLKQLITTRESKFLQCALDDRFIVNLPFGCEGCFKTLGDLKQEYVLLKEAVQHCKLPRFVKFIDKNLKVKKVDDVRRQPISLSQFGEVALREVIIYSDVIVCKPTIAHGSVDGVEIMTVPLDSDIEVIGFSIEPRDFASFTDTVKPEMVKRLAIQHGSWIVYEDRKASSFDENKEQLPPLSPRRISLQVTSVRLNRYNSEATPKSHLNKEVEKPPLTSNGFSVCMKKIQSSHKLWKDNYITTTTKKTAFPPSSIYIAAVTERQTFEHVVQANYQSGSSAKNFQLHTQELNRRTGSSQPLSPGPIQLDASRFYGNYFQVHQDVPNASKEENIHGCGAMLRDIHSKENENCIENEMKKEKNGHDRRNGVKLVVLDEDDNGYVTMNGELLTQYTGIPSTSSTAFTHTE